MPTVVYTEFELDSMFGCDRSIKTSFEGTENPDWLVNLVTGVYCDLAVHGLSLKGWLPQHIYMGEKLKFSVPVIHSRSELSTNVNLIGLRFTTHNDLGKEQFSYCFYVETVL